jgi:hypothetical protein
MKIARISLRSTGPIELVLHAGNPIELALPMESPIDPDDISTNHSTGGGGAGAVRSVGINDKNPGSTLHS